MKTQQAIVLPSGWEAKPVNPYATSEKVYTEVYNLFDKNNPSRPLTKYHTPGAKVEVKEVWQQRLKYEWCDEPDDYKWVTISGKPTVELPAFEIRTAFEVVSEEESKPLQQIFDEIKDHPRIEALLGNSVEEAAEKYCTYKTKRDNAISHNAFIAGANHILQSGEYVKVSDVEDALLKVGHIRPSLIIRVLKTLKNKQ